MVSKFQNFLEEQKGSLTARSYSGGDIPVTKIGEFYYLQLDPARTELEEYLPYQIFVQFPGKKSELLGVVSHSGLFEATVESVSNFLLTRARARRARHIHNAHSTRLLLANCRF